MTSPISHADVLRAMQRMRPKTDRARRQIAQLLGFEWKVAAAIRRRQPSRERVKRHDQTPHRPRSLRRGAAPAPEQAPPQPVSFTLSGPELAKPSPIALPTPLPDFSRPDVLVLEPAPLFVPRWTRAILSTALSSFTDAGGIDIVETVRLVAAGHALRRLPRRRVARMAPAAHVLVDAGGSMIPFLADQVRLTAELAQVVGGSAIEVLKFIGTPLRKAGRGPRGSWQPYAPPPASTAIVLISDLGLADTGLLEASASPAEWSRFLEWMQVRGCRVIALVPYGSRRWPLEIARLARLITWDRSTTVRQVRFKAP